MLLLFLLIYYKFIINANISSEAQMRWGIIDQPELHSTALYNIHVALLLSQRAT